MKKLVLIALLVTSFSYGQLHVSNGSYLYVNNEQVFVGDFGDAASDINLEGTATGPLAYSQANNGYIFLRNQGQLFQTTTANSTLNTGLGKISIYQEGTANEYTFNYWSSPVQDPTANLGTGFNTTIGFYDPDVDDLNPTVAALIGGVNGNAAPLQIASFWLFTFTGDSGGNATANFEQVGSSDITGEFIPPGFGFTMKGTNGTSSANPGDAQQYDFRGRPNTGTINVPVFLDRFTFVGNPYPSAMDVQQFLLDPDNSEIDGAAYFWQQAPATTHFITDYVGGYGTYVPAPAAGLFTPATFTTFDVDGVSIGGALGMGADLPRQIITVAQGFFVFTTTDTTIDAGVDENVTFKNDYRVFVQESASTSVFQGIEKEDDVLLLSGRTQQNSQATIDENEEAIVDYSILRFETTIGNDDLIKPMALSFFDGATDGFDRTADGLDISGLRNTVYWPIEDREFVIQGTFFDVDKEIPLAFRAQDESEFTVRITEKENFSQTILIFLLDRETGESHNITDLPYSFTLEEGTYENRFVITFRQIEEIDDDSSDDDVIAENFGQNNVPSLQAFQDNIIKQLSIQNVASLNVSTITMYDVTGKIMFSDNPNSINQTYTYGTGQYSTGIYIVNISVEGGEDITTKIAINN